MTQRNLFRKTIELQYEDLQVSNHVYFLGDMSHLTTFQAFFPDIMRDFPVDMRRGKKDQGL